MVPYGPPDIKFSVEIPKSPFGDIENFTKLAHHDTTVRHCFLGLDNIRAGLGIEKGQNWDRLV